MARGAELAGVTAALELSGVDVAIGGRAVLTDVSVQANAGEVLGVLGPNGAGKTTLLRAALGLARLTAGTAHLGGKPVARLSEAELASLAGYLPQERRVGWNLPAWRIAALGAPHLSPADANTRALEALDDVGMLPLSERGVLDMSGGERARVLLARLIATRAPLLVADEPAAGLDPDAQFMALELLRARAAVGAAVVVTLHDLTLAARTCDRLAVLSEGRLVAFGPPDEALAPGVLAAAFDLHGALVNTPAGVVVAVRRAEH